MSMKLVLSESVERKTVASPAENFLRLTFTTIVRCNLENTLLLINLLEFERYLKRIFFLYSFFVFFFLFNLISYSEIIDDSYDCCHIFNSPIAGLSSLYRYTFEYPMNFHKLFIKDERTHPSLNFDEK